VGEYMQSYPVHIGTGTVSIEYDKYDTGSGVPPTVEYKDGDSVVNCEADSWNTYSVPFVSSGYVQIRVTN